MTTRHRSSRKLHSRHVFSAMGFLGLLVSVTAWAHQAGLINWQLPDFIAKPRVAISQTHVTQPNSPISVSNSGNGSGSGMGTAAGASDANCAGQLLGGKAPTLTNDKLAAKTHQLCYLGFAVLNSGITRTPLWSAEHLTANRVETAQGLPRKNSFHADPNLPTDERAELIDYKGYPYDRGHMAPNADMPDIVSQKECFTLANMIPQDKDNNEHLWAHIEESVRNLAERDADLNVVTGPIFDGDTVKELHDRVMVPTKIFKAVYDVKKQEAAAYIVDNAPGETYRVVTIAQLETMTGIKVFPGLPAKVDTSTKLELPAPLASDLIN
jgi:endonuclease G